MPIDKVNATAFSRDQEGYEELRQSTVWNGRVPDRSPEVIVRPTDEAQVVEAVRYAREENMQIGVRSGGHSWSASFLRDDGMLIDLSGMTEISVDHEARLATVGPGVQGGELLGALDGYGLSFPSGHSPSVAVGGFLLQGGFGWNSRKVGLGCENVVAVDAVTADGEVVRADTDTNPDLYWAARGTGPGFFAVVTRFHLRLHPQPKVMSSTYLFAEEDLDDLVCWAEEAQPDFPRCLEVSMFIGREQAGVPGVTVALRADACGETEAEAREALEVVDALPNSVRPLHREAFVTSTLGDLMEWIDEQLGSRGRRYEVDNMWTDASAPELLPGIHAMVDSLPPHPSHLYLFFWGPTRTLPDMAFSMQAKLWLSYPAVGEDPSLDADHARLVADGMRSMEALSTGIQLADENLAARPCPFMAEENFRRSEQIRAIYDPDRRFHTYMGLPVEWR